MEPNSLDPEILNAHYIGHFLGLAEGATVYVVSGGAARLIAELRAVEASYEADVRSTRLKVTNPWPLICTRCAEQGVREPEEAEA